MALSFLFSGFEAGFVSLDRYFVLFLSDIKKEKVFGKIKNLLHKKELVLTSLLLCNNLTIVAATFVFNSFIVPDILSIFQVPSANHAVIQIVSSVIILTPILFFFCEVLPKALFKTYPYRLTKRCYPLFIPFYIATYPATLCLSALSKSLLLLFKTRGKKNRITDETAYFTGTLSLVNRKLLSSIEDESIKKIASHSQFSIKDFAREIDFSLTFSDSIKVKDAKEKILANNSIMENSSYIFVTMGGEIKGFIKINALNKTGDSTRLRNIMRSIKKIDPKTIPLQNFFAYLDESVVLFEENGKSFFIDNRILLKKMFA